MLIFRPVLIVHKYAIEHVAVALHPLALSYGSPLQSMIMLQLCTAIKAAAILM